MVMLFVVMTATAAAFLVIVMVMLVVMMMVLFFHLLQVSGYLCLAFHCLHQLCACQLIPRCCYDGSLRIMLAEQFNRLIQLLGRNCIGTGQYDGCGSFDLIVIELTKVLHIDLDLAGIHNSNGAIQLYVVIGHLFHGGHNIGQLANAGGLDHDTIRIILSNDLI